MANACFQYVRYSALKQRINQSDVQAENNENIFAFTQWALEQFIEDLHSKRRNWDFDEKMFHLKKLDYAKNQISLTNGFLLNYVMVFKICKLVASMNWNFYINWNSNKKKFKRKLRVLQHNRKPFVEQPQSKSFPRILKATRTVRILLAKLNKCFASKSLYSDWNWQYKNGCLSIWENSRPRLRARRHQMIRHARCFVFPR